MLFTVGLAKKSLPVVEAPVGWDPALAVYCATALLALSLSLQFIMSMVFNMQPTQMKTDAEFTKRRLDAATSEPNYWRFSKLQLNTGEYVPTMAMLMYYLFSVYKASTLPPIAAYGCIISTAGAYSFVVGMATQAGTIWGASLKPPFAPPPLRALGALGRYAGLGMLIYSAYVASV